MGTAMLDQEMRGGGGGGGVPRCSVSQWPIASSLDLPAESSALIRQRAAFQSQTSKNNGGPQRSWHTVPR